MEFFKQEFGAVRPPGSQGTPGRGCGTCSDGGREPTAWIWGGKHPSEGLRESPACRSDPNLLPREAPVIPCPAAHFFGGGLRMGDLSAQQSSAASPAALHSVLEATEQLLLQRDG